MSSDKLLLQIQQAIMEPVIKNTFMKKLIYISLIIISFCLCYYIYYIKSDKKILKDFAYEVVDDSTSVDDVILKYVTHTKKGEKTALFVLNFIKEEYKKNPDRIVVYTPEEAGRSGQKFQIELNDTEKLYYMKFNKDMILPFLVNKESKIIVLLVLTKGNEGGTLSNDRSDQ